MRIVSVALILAFTFTFAMPARGKEPVEPMAKIFTEADPTRFVLYIATEPGRSTVYTQFEKALFAAIPRDMKWIVPVSGSKEFLARFRKKHSNPRFRIIPTEVDNKWIRDYGPELVTTKDGKLRMVAFRSVLHEGQEAEIALLREIAQSFGAELVLSDLKHDGGNTLIDHKRRMYLTEITQLANPQVPKKEIEAEFMRLLEVTEVNWLPLLPGEPTGHVDMYAKYVGIRNGAPSVIVSESDYAPHQPALEQAAALFQSKDLKVTRISTAGREESGLVRPYSNSILANDLALVPTYFDPKAGEPRPEFKKRDLAALRAYRSLGFKTKSIPSYEVIRAQGTVHCLVRTLGELTELSPTP